MNQEEVIDEMAKSSELTKKQAEKALKAFMKIVGTALSQDNKVILAGFGTFEPRQRKERLGRNPQTGESITVRAARIAKFSAGKYLKDLVLKG